MKTILKGGTVINVFTGETEHTDVLIEDETIVGVGDYKNEPSDIIRDVAGKYICPGFIDGHIHIESTMLTPPQFMRAVLPHGTTTVVADPHEIANVCGSKGIEYMLESSNGLPVSIYFVLPSCVPTTRFDENGATINALDLESFYNNPRVIGLGEVMDFPSVIAAEEAATKKIEAAKRRGLIINGHAPLLTGHNLDRYISAGISDDHECSSFDEAKERIRKGQIVMIRQGTAARNLTALLLLFNEPWSHRCILVSDDKHPADLLRNGHIDDIIRQASKAGKSPIVGIQMATINAAEHFGLKNIGAVAPGYTADILILDDLKSVSVGDVYRNGLRVVENHNVIVDCDSRIIPKTDNSVRHSFHIEKLTDLSFHIDCAKEENCRIIDLKKGELTTDIGIEPLDFSRSNGINITRDILKIAVVERHHNTGHIGLGFIRGMGLKSGAIASSVSHDSHNLIIVGTNEADMAIAGNKVSLLDGGCVVIQHKKVLAQMPLPIAGLMSELSASEIAEQNEAVRQAAYTLGATPDIEPFMNMAFISLPVIPHIKITSLGLIDVDSQKTLSLFAKEEMG